MWQHARCNIKDNMTNYRPISLLKFFFKVLKKATHSRLSQHLHVNNILVTEQYSFRKRILTEDAAFSLTDGVLKSINQKMPGGRIFCDLAKPFDCVTHAIFC